MNQNTNNAAATKVVPANSRFFTPTAVSGVVVFVKPVTEMVHRTKRRNGSLRTVGPRYMRLRVLVRTDEGWTLAGTIGKASHHSEVPDVRVGDRIQVEPIVLSRSYGQVYQWDKGIYMPAHLCRTLRGKVTRARQA